MLQAALPFGVEIGILAGLAVAATGYFQEYSKGKDSGEKFSIDKFTLTIVLGAVVGGTMAYVSDFDSALALFLINAGIIAIINSIVRSLYRLSN